MRKLFYFLLAAVTMTLAACDGNEPTGPETDLNLNPEIGTWAGFRKGVATFTFDDGCASHFTDVAPLFDQYGFKASFYLVVSWNPDWNGFQRLADNGHEIGSHSNTHGQNMTGEEASSKQAINDYITSQFGCITVAYPNGNLPTNMGAVYANYIAGRGIKEAMIAKDGPANWYEIPVYFTGTAGINNTNGLTEKMQKAIQQNGWVVFLSHGLSGKDMGTYSPTDINAINGALQWAYQNNRDIWVTSLCNATMYCKERQATQVKVVSEYANIATLSLKHHIAESICNYSYPLSLRVKKPEEWSNVEIKQGDKLLDAEIRDGSIYFDAIPNADDIVLKKK